MRFKTAPTILVITDYDSQRLYFKNYARGSSFLFHPLDLSIPPHEQAKTIVNTLRRK